ncbi:fibronectin type III domain-containing protein [Actinokineospora sp. G85]|uniref:fibronectin type III domain-containing protein n=1 Tax=Actinokineospora sp. G85 TaxID=3406626 RepID=UPI003C726216
MARPPSAPAGITVTEGVATGNSQVSLSVSWSAPADNGSPITGYRVAAACASGEPVVTQVTTTTATLALPCAAGGRVTVQVTAANAAGTGATGSASISVKGAPPAPTQPPVTTTTTTQAPPPPLPTTTTEPPPPPPPTTQEPPPPPPKPAAGATVITGGSAADFTATLSLAAPADWRTYGVSCAVVNLTYPTTGGPIPCTSTTGTVGLTNGNNRLVVRVAAADGSQVDSAPYTIFFRPFIEPPPDCGPYVTCQIPASVQTSPAERELPQTTMAAAGIGLLLTALVVRATGRPRRRPDTFEPDETP